MAGVVEALLNGDDTMEVVEGKLLSEAEEEDVGDAGLRRVVGEGEVASQPPPSSVEMNKHS